MTYDLETDGLEGCYILWRSEKQPLHVRFDVEDATTFDEIQYVCVELVDSSDPDECSTEGVVNTIEDVKEICRLVENGRTEEAGNILLEWDQLEGKLASREIAELHRPENWNQKEGRPNTDEEKADNWKAYEAEWADIDRECNPILEAFFTDMQTNQRHQLN